VTAKFKENAPIEPVITVTAGVDEIIYIFRQVLISL